MFTIFSLSQQILSGGLLLAIINGKKKLILVVGSNIN